MYVSFIGISGYIRRINMGSIRTFIIMILMIREASLKEFELVQHLRQIGAILVTHGGDVVTYQNNNYNPINVIDGRDGNPDECDCCASLIRPAWININLGEPRPFSRIHLVGRPSSPNNLHSTQFSDLQITINTGQDGRKSLPISNVNNMFTVNASTSLQYVKSINVSTTNSFQDDHVMTLCDVKIFQNVNITSQSSTWSTCVAENAINGQRFNELSLCSACSATDVDNTPWWELDLGFINLIGAISVQGRTDTSDRQSRNLIIYISNVTVGPDRTAEAVNNPSDNTEIIVNLNPVVLSIHSEIDVLGNVIVKISAVQ
ncbi:uncharacterized protein LOC127872603 [Dreissena polymorpha]|uniref:uncharacterized protein LOC127872603 n=1 Tax=Dreissena polymorpha TaxID=45954 RepID=UPI00226436E0|nr:uncharacterized protein LOC127872603 [Dreissena polymorpha]